MRALAISEWGEDHVEGRSADDRLVCPVHDVEPREQPPQFRVGFVDGNHIAVESARFENLADLPSESLGKAVADAKPAGQLLRAPG